ncbi:MAG: histidine phosphatase family protein [Nitriliruptoraceae bacterium]
MSVRRLLLVRHGETVWNVARRVQGQSCSGLTDRGRAQAARVGEPRAARGPVAGGGAAARRRGGDPAAPLGVGLARTVHHDPVLRERAFGRWEGWSRDELVGRDGDRYRRWRAGDESVLAEVGGETDTVLQGRAGGAFRSLLGLDVASWPADVAEAGTVVAVTHGGTIFHGLVALLGLDPRRLGAVDNASVTELLLGAPGPAPDDGSPRLVRFNETAHLAGIAGD